MKKMVPFICVVLLFGGFLLLKNLNPETTGAPPYYVSEEDTIPPVFDDEYLDLSNWKRPEGPYKVGIQAGHWKSDELPDELARLRGNTGAIGSGKTEAEVNLAIAQEAAKILKERNIQVDILPATIPKDYWADVFISIHADGHTDTSKTGFKAAAPRRDYTGKADELIELIRKHYETKTGMSWDEQTITRNMRGYYAFSWWRFDHAVHPMTTSAILETGFLTNPSDARFLINSPEIPAEAIAEAVKTFLEENIKI